MVQKKPKITKRKNLQVKDKLNSDKPFDRTDIDRWLDGIEERYGDAIRDLAKS